MLHKYDYKLNTIILLVLSLIMFICGFINIISNIILHIQRNSLFLQSEIQTKNITK